MDGVYQGDSDRPTGNNISVIGNYSGGSQTFAEFLDDFRVYGIALSDFEVEMIFSESRRTLLDVGKDSYSTSIWLKADSFKSAPVYDFAIGWFEGGGGEHMQAKFSKGSISDYNYLNYIISHYTVFVMVNEIVPLQ